MVAATRQARFEVRKTTHLMATTTFPTRDDFAALLNESLGGENETFEGKVVKGTVTGDRERHGGDRRRPEVAKAGSRCASSRRRARRPN